MEHLERKSSIFLKHIVVLYTSGQEYAGTVGDVGAPVISGDYSEEVSHSSHRQREGG